MSSNLPKPVAQRVLFYDIETGPLLAHIWHPKQGWVSHDQMIHDTFMLSWAAKWAGERTVHGAVLSSDEVIAQDDTRIVHELAELIREADVVVAHNGDRFDLKKANWRVMKAGLEPLGPVRTIDTLKLSKNAFGPAYHKLDYLAEELLGENKIKTDFKLWEKAYHGDARALRYMLKYNKKDVILLERVFDKMLPYVRTPIRLYDAGWSGQEACPTCGNLKLHKRGVRRTNAGAFQRWHCPKCGRYSRSRSAMEIPKLKTVPL